MKDQNSGREAASCPIPETHPEILLEYCSGTLQPSQAAEFSGHVAGCAACQRVVEEQRQVWDLLEHWTPAEVAQDFDKRLYARIAQEAAVSPWTRWWLRISHSAVPQSLWKPALSLAAACAVIAIALWVRTPGPSENPKQVRSENPVRIENRIDNVDIEQVESALEDLDILTPVS